MTAEEVKTYLEETYGECKHDEYALADAVNQTQQDINYNNEWDLFHLLVKHTYTIFTYTQLWFSYCKR